MNAPRRTLKERIGFDAGRRLPAEEAIEFAGANDVFFMDIQTDLEPNSFESFDDARCDRIRKLKDRFGIRLGLHTLSGVNVAEISPFCRDAVDEYLRAYVDLSQKLDADWIVVHGGYHFTSCRNERMQASVERLQRISEYAEKAGAQLLLENLQWEPVLAEVNYLPVTPAECRWYFEQLPCPNIKWSFTANHAHLLPGSSIAAFVDAMPFIELCREVRLADNNGVYEIHQHPGEGTVDFGALFKKIEGLGYQGHYTNGWGTLEAMIEGRDYMLARAHAAGVNVD
ncbi:MAG: sugar phosphate isomerase/epimerase [Phycisphaerae bacterium]|jgi:sugar phosphate isomerase/epimerase|nr:sugar phosphate isomerase/epimerase [Phycisphaerae bacterium]